MYGTLGKRGLKHNSYQMSEFEVCGERARFSCGCVDPAVSICPWGLGLMMNA